MPPILYQDIPNPKLDDPQSVIAALGAIIQNLQVLTGKLGTRGAAASVTVFTKNSALDPDPVGNRDGDIWVQPPRLPTDVWVIRFWINGAWQRYT